MVELKLRTAPDVKNRTVGKVMGRMKLANFLNLPTEDFRGIIREIEENPLFKRMVYPVSSNDKIINYRKFPSSRLSLRFYEFREEISTDYSSPDIAGLLKKKQRLIGKIKSIGLEKFKKYFLHNEGNWGVEDISRKCSVSMEETRKIIRLVDDVSLLEEFSFGDPVDPAHSPSYSRVADVEPEKGEYIISYLVPNYARGRYAIDYKRLLRLKEDGTFSKNELAEIERLIVKMELINTRKTLVYRVIQCLIENQKGFFRSGDEDDIKSLTQRKVASILGITPGVLSRVITGKSIGTPQGKEKPLKSFFPSNKLKRKQIIREIVDESSGFTGRSKRVGIDRKVLSDMEVREHLREKHDIILSRRSICQYRNEMNI